ncbi:MAG: aldehyde dehydrogenase family protein [Polaromonas sp.]|nr:aldehyde dehydrogenase family protein [Polaromonas sp.]
MTLQPTSASAQDIHQVFDSQLATALRWRTSTAHERIERIKKLREVLLANREALYAAFWQDMHKSPSEVEATELLHIMDEMRHAIGSIKSWMKTRSVWPTMTTMGTRGSVQMQSKGRVLIIAPWNYPLSLCMGPLVSALAAGNTVILKPSEMTPAVSGVMAKIVNEVFAKNEVALFEGALETSQTLLALPFDHIFFTGSPAVGKVVMSAAAKHLCSVTLELGGKSPTIVDASADIAMTAQSVMWGKFINNGQTCIAPDYVYVHESVKSEFLQACKTAISQFYGDTSDKLKNNPDLTRIVNSRHAERVNALLTDATQRGAKIIVGGETDISTNFIAPTLLGDIPPDAKIMQEEIFGPLLPIISYTDINQVIASINAEPKPLALYIYSRDNSVVDQVLGQTSSGGACVNHCLLHFAHGNLPFGGVNNSGIGSAHGLYGFKAFSHERAVLKGTWLRTIKMFFPPYTAGRQKMIRQTVDMLRLPKL